MVAPVRSRAVLLQVLNVDASYNAVQTVQMFVAQVIDDGEEIVLGYVLFEFVVVVAAVRVRYRGGFVVQFAFTQLFDRVFCPEELFEGLFDVLEQENRLETN